MNPDAPINEWDDGNRTSFLSGCFFVYFIGFCLTCSLFTGMALASYL